MIEQLNAKLMALMKHKIEEGDTITLIIGGPEMLVEVIDEDGLVYCIWFNCDMELQKDRFVKDSLRLVSKKESTA